MVNFLEEIIDLCAIEDLMNGYVYDSGHRVYICIFCGKVYEEDLIYKYGEQLFSARKAVEAHINEEHNGSFDMLVEQEKRLTGLSDRQVEIFKILFTESDNKNIAEKMETTPATVRSYKFKLREKLRQSKIYSALFYLIEQKNNENCNLSIIDKAIQEKDVASEKKINNIEKDDNLLNDKYGDVDLNKINLFNSKRNLL